MDEMGKTVITPNEVKKHTIRPYNFRAIKSLTKNPTQSDSTGAEDESIKPKHNLNATDDPHGHFDYNNQQGIILDKKLLEITENILKKAEDLDTNLKDVQGQLEAQREQFSRELEDSKKLSYESGFKDGEASSIGKLQNSIDEIKIRFKESIEELNRAIQESKNIVGSFEKELSSVALDISKEVIIKEISEHSKEIALQLARELISSLNDAHKISLKVNPEDFEYIKENLEDSSNIELTPNKAIAKGGVVITSDAGNIDGNVMMRYNNIKRSILEAQNS